MTTMQTFYTELTMPQRADDSRQVQHLRALTRLTLATVKRLKMALSWSYWG